MSLLQNHPVSDFVKGIFMGIANIMPGVSGGTLAISFGVYDRMIGAVSGIFRDYKRSFRVLFPLLAGMSVGIVCFAYVMEYLFIAYPFFSAMAFAGLILGIISAASMIIPGVSGSLILMVLGYYYGILHAVRSLLEGIRTLDFSLFSQNFYLLLPFGVGIVPGIFLFSRLLEYLFRTHAAAVYSAVLGLIAASPAAILIHTGSLSGTLTARLLPGIAVFIFCIFISKKFED